MCGDEGGLRAGQNAAAARDGAEGGLTLALAGGPGIWVLRGNAGGLCLAQSRSG